MRSGNEAADGILSLFPLSHHYRNRKILRRSTAEAGTAFSIHLAIMCFYIYVHVYDATIVRRNRGKGFEGSELYGGRWKFLTYLNMVRLTLFQLVL